jgi:hypothetical protein
MMIYTLGGKGPLKVDGYHDPDTIRPFVVTFQPQAWAAGTVYNKGAVVIPTTYKGLYYEAVNPGKSHATTEPTWELTVGDTTNDFEANKTEGLTWIARAYDMLPIGESISTVTFTPNSGVTLASSSSNAYSASFTVAAIASDAAARTTLSFQVRLRCVTDTSRSFDLTLEFKLAEW